MSNVLSFTPLSVLLEQGEHLPVQLVPVEVLMLDVRAPGVHEPNDPRKLHTARPILSPLGTSIASHSHARTTGCGVLLWAPPSPQTTPTPGLANSIQGL